MALMQARIRRNWSPDLAAGPGENPGSAPVVDGRLPELNEREQRIAAAIDTLRSLSDSDQSCANKVAGWLSGDLIDERNYPRTHHLKDLLDKPEKLTEEIIKGLKTGEPNETRQFSYELQHLWPHRTVLLPALKWTSDQAKELERILLDVPKKDQDPVGLATLIGSSVPENHEALRIMIKLGRWGQMSGKLWEKVGESLLEGNDPKLQSIYLGLWNRLDTRLSQAQSCYATIVAVCSPLIIPSALLERKVRLPKALNINWAVGEVHDKLFDILGVPISFRGEFIRSSVTPFERSQRGRTGPPPTGFVRWINKLKRQANTIMEMEQVSPVFGSMIDLSSEKPRQFNRLARTLEKFLDNQKGADGSLIKVKIPELSGAIDRDNATAIDLCRRLIAEANSPEIRARALQVLMASSNQKAWNSPPDHGFDEACEKASCDIPLLFAGTPMIPSRTEDPEPVLRKFDSHGSAYLLASLFPGTARKEVLELICKRGAASRPESNMNGIDVSLDLFLLNKVILDDLSEHRRMRKFM